jgi:hypothetical protein
MDRADQARLHQGVARTRPGRADAAGGEADRPGGRHRGDRPAARCGDPAVPDRVRQKRIVNGQRNCFSRTSWQKWAITKVELEINPAHGAAIEGCIIHEALHSFGFTSHPHDGDSVPSRRRTLTVLDRNLIHALYDKRIAPA